MSPPNLTFLWHFHFHFKAKDRQIDRWAEDTGLDKSSEAKLQLHFNCDRQTDKYLKNYTVPMGKCIQGYVKTESYLTRLTPPCYDITKYNTRRSKHKIINLKSHTNKPKNSK